MTTSMPPQELWSWFTALLGLFLILLILFAFNKPESGGSTRTPSGARVVLASLVGIATGVAILVILLTDEIRLVVGVVLAVTAFYFVLALWRVPLARSVKRRSVAPIISAGAFFLLTVPFWWPFSAQEWLLVLAPFVFAAAVGSAIGGVVKAARKKMAREEARRRQIELNQLAMLLRAKLAKEITIEEERSRVQMLADAMRDKRERRCRQNVKQEAEALTKATAEMEAKGTRKIKREIRILRRALKKLYLAVGRKVRSGIRLQHLARLTGFSIEQTYSLVSTLEDRGLVTTEREPDRKLWIEIWVFLSETGAREVEKGTFVTNKVKVGKGAAYLGRASGPVVQSVTRDVSGEVQVGATIEARSLDEVLRAAQALRANMTDNGHIEALDAQLAGIENASEPHEKKSILEQLKGFALAFGPLARPLVDAINGALALLRSAE